MYEDKYVSVCVCVCRCIYVRICMSIKFKRWPLCAREKVRVYSYKSEYISCSITCIKTNPSCMRGDWGLGGGRDYIEEWGRQGPHRRVGGRHDAPRGVGEAETPPRQSQKKRRGTATNERFSGRYSRVFRRYFVGRLGSIVWFPSDRGRVVTHMWVFVSLWLSGIRVTRDICCVGNVDDRMARGLHDVNFDFVIWILWLVDLYFSGVENGFLTSEFWKCDKRMRLYSATFYLFIS